MPLLESLRQHYPMGSALERHLYCEAGHKSIELRQQSTMMIMKMLLFGKLDSNIANWTNRMLPHSLAIYMPN